MQDDASSRDRTVIRDGGSIMRDPDDELSLVELVNRVLDRGAVISGDVTISVAGVDLVYVGLRVLLASVESMVARENTGRTKT